MFNVEYCERKRHTVKTEGTMMMCWVVLYGVIQCWRDIISIYWGVNIHMALFWRERMEQNIGHKMNES